MSPPFLSPDRWYHIAVTFNDSSHAQIYIDGVLNSEVSNVNCTPAVLGYATIGAWDDGSILTRFAKGAIDDVRIYSRVLDPCEISELAGTRVGLVAHLDFEDSGYLGKDVSGCENDGNVNGGPVWTSPGIIGNGSLTFDGADDTIDFPFSDALNINFEEDFSWSAWIDTTNGGPVIAWSRPCYRNKRPSTLCLYVNSSGYLVLESADVGSLVSTQTVTDGPHHVAITCEADTGVPPGDDGWDTVTMYIDAAPDGLKDDWEIQEPPAASPQIKIGCSSSNFPTDAPLKFDGQIDDVRIYKRCLSQTDVEDIYNQTETCCSVDVGGGGGEIRP